MTPLRQLARNSLVELLQHKSFFLLIFLLYWADKYLKRVVPPHALGLNLKALVRQGETAAVYVFTELPGYLLEFLFDSRTLWLAGGLFLFKQLISLWPSSDMRRMHRRERSGFGLIGSLAALRGRQMLWDAVAVATVLGFATLWSGFCFVLCRGLWGLKPHVVWLAILALLILSGTPLVMAGFSYSSKIAVISRGGFREKLRLFFRLWTDTSILGPSWVFFTLRIVLETVFVVVLPGLVLLYVPWLPLRLLLAGTVAALVYSFLKMASFKFFLHIYAQFPLVRQEYADYFRGQETS